jgi:hypothetical protein
MRRLLFVSLLLVALLALPQRGQAWGLIGHFVVAEIAEHHLTPEALDQVHALLRDEGFEHLDQVASWPDTIRRERPEASPWHYVGIPLEEDAYVATRDCESGNCAVAAIEHFRAILADRTQPIVARREALKFLVHFVGDLHQPLHGADNANDHGGNKVLIDYFGVTSDNGYPLSLHWVWDTSIIEHRLGVKEGPLSQANLEAKRAAAIEANEIDRHFGKSLAAEAARSSDPAVWAMESHDAAKRWVYPGVVAVGATPPATPITLGAAYQARSWPVIERRLDLAGLRLAALLNKTLVSE